MTGMNGLLEGASDHSGADSNDDQVLAPEWKVVSIFFLTKLKTLLARTISLSPAAATCRETKLISQKSSGAGLSENRKTEILLCTSLHKELLTKVKTVSQMHVALWIVVHCCLLL